MTRHSKLSVSVAGFWWNIIIVDLLENRHENQECLPFYCFAHFAHGDIFRYFVLSIPIKYPFVLNGTFCSRCSDCGYMRYFNTWYHLNDTKSCAESCLEYLVFRAQVRLQSPPSILNRLYFSRSFIKSFANFMTSTTSITL